MFAGMARNSFCDRSSQGRSVMLFRFNSRSAQEEEEFSAVERTRNSCLSSHWSICVQVLLPVFNFLLRVEFGWMEWAANFSLVLE